MTNPHEESFQKYICCRLIDDKSEKVELFEVTHAVWSYSSDGIFKFWAIFDKVMSVYFQKIAK